MRNLILKVDTKCLHLYYRLKSKFNLSISVFAMKK